MKTILCLSLILASMPALAFARFGTEITDSCLSRTTDCEAIETSLESRDMPISDYNGVITYLPRYRMQSAFGYTLQMTEASYFGGNTRTIQVPRTERAISDWKSDAGQARTEAQARCQDQRADVQRLYTNCK